MSQHLLMIEDDARLAGMVAEYLEQNAFKVSHCPSGTSGLDYLRQPAAKQASVDLVILDLMLPDMDGLEVCRRIRALDGPQARTPVLMLTAKGFELEHAELMNKWGIIDIVAKPFSPRELVRKIDQIVGTMPASA